LLLINDEAAGALHSAARHRKEVNMIESTQSGGLWPQLYAPFKSLGTRVADWLAPASDASSNRNAYRINVELPGVSEEDIHLTVEGDVVTVSGEKSETKEETGDTWYFSERQFGSFRRSFRLPEDADAEGAEAHVRNGVLEISIPRKTANTEKSRKIEVKKA
jgi:HSP20 family protein